LARPSTKNRPEWDAIADAAQAGGGRTRQDKFYATEMSRKMVEAFMRQNLTGVAKDMLMASIRSVGWNLGTKREVLGGAADFGLLTPRV
jgi:hypothetical protein